MSSQNLDSLDLEAEIDSNPDSATDSEITTDDEFTDDGQNNNAFGRAIEIIDEYLKGNSPIYHDLQRERIKGWKSKVAHRYFSEKEREAEENPAEAIAKLEKKMKKVAEDIQDHTQAFTIELKTQPKRILDLSVVPSAFLIYALEENYGAHALAFSLPEKDGGFDPTVEESEAVRIQVLDITMLVADLGAMDSDEIPKRKHQAHRFRYSHYFDGGCTSLYDLVICDSTIQPTSGMFKGSRESRRRLLTQLIIGLENLRVGGKMIIQLQKLEHIQTIRLILQFIKFAEVEILQHGSWVGKLASFYLIATEVQSTSQKAREAIQEWRREWKVVTLGTNKQWRAHRNRLARCGSKGVEGVLEKFGPHLLDMGHVMWQRQIDHLAQAPWKTRHQPAVLSSHASTWRLAEC